MVIIEELVSDEETNEIHSDSGPDETSEKKPEEPPKVEPNKPNVEPKEAEKLDENPKEEQEGEEDSESDGEADEEKIDAKEVEAAKRQKQYTVEEEVQMCEYIHQFTHDKETPDIVEKFIGQTPNKRKFWEGFIVATGSTRLSLGLYIKYPRLIKKLHLLPISTEMKMDLYYSLSIPIHEDFIEIVKKEVNISMDKERNIEEFEMKSAAQMAREEKMRQKKIPKKRRSNEQVQSSVSTDAPPMKRGKSSFDEEEDVKMWKFLHERIFDSETNSVKKDEKLKPKSVFLWREYLGGEEADKEEVLKYCRHYDTLKKNLHKMSMIDDRTKLDLYYGLSIPINTEYLKSLSSAPIKTDENGNVLEYNSASFVTRTRLY